MSENVGALAVVFEKQKLSSYQMIKSFREHNPDSSIVVLTDGPVDGIDEICLEYNCECLKRDECIGYPASTDINVPLKYLHRFFQSSFSIKENYFINLEPDCLVKGHITMPCANYDCVISPDTGLQWLHYHYGNDEIRGYILPRMFDFYKKHDVYKEPIHDLIMGGGGDIYNVNFVKALYSEWDMFVYRSFQIKKIYDECWLDFVWYQDYLLSLQLPFYGQSKYGGRDYAKNIEDIKYLKDRIFHLCKQYYVK
jgi:hypothetical protein